MISSNQRRVALLVIAIAPCLQLGCSQPTKPTFPLSSPALSLEQPLPAAGHSARRVAFIALSGEAITVDVPSAARAGQPLLVAVTTYGGGCISEDTTVVDVHEHLADVVPYQRIYQPGRNEGCTMELRVNRRQVAVVFPERGVATVRVIGRVAGDSLASVTRQVAIE